MRIQKRKRNEWHLWFAFFPVEIDNIYVFLETIERRIDENDWIEYRLINK